MSQFSDELKAHADIAALIGEFVSLQRRGERWIGLCPFHHEKTPSFNVMPSRQFYYCFGCHAHGDVYRFLMELQKIPFSEAVAIIADKLQVPMPRSLGGGEESGERGALLKLHEIAADFYARQLRGNTGVAGRSYLSNREVGQSAIERFHLGYAGDDGRALTSFLRSQPDLKPRTALTAGLCMQRRESAVRKDRVNDGSESGAVSWDDMYDRFRGRVVFPISNEQGRVIAFGGRALSPDAAKGVPKYLNSPETPIYTKGHVVYNLDRAREAIRKLGYFILVEGYLDCLSVFMAGFENVVAACGTALTAAQVERLGRYSRNAVLSLDPDAAGASATEKHIAALLEEGFQIRIAQLPAGADPDEFIRQHGKEAYGERLGASQPYFDYMLQHARQRFDVRRPEGKSAALAFLLPYLNRLHDPVTRSELVDRIADQLKIDNQLVRQQTKTATRERRNEVQVALPSLLAAERVLLRAWMEWSHERDALTSIIRQERLFEGLAAGPLFETLANAVGESFDALAIAERLDPTDRRLLATLLVDEGIELAEAEVAGAITALRERAVEGQRRELRQALEKAEKSRDHDQVKQLLGALQQLNVEQAKLRSTVHVRAVKAL